MVLSSGSWIAAQVRAGVEKHVAALLTAKGYELFLPTYERKRRWSDRIKYEQVPLFPGYVFCRITGQEYGPLYSTAGVVRLVGVGRVPAVIPDSEIENLQRAVHSRKPLSPATYLTTGRKVRVSAGPLMGAEGRFIATKGVSQLVVSVHLLQRSVAVEVDAEDVEAI